MSFSYGFDASKPAIADTRLNVVDLTRKNLVGLTMEVLSGGVLDAAWTLTITGGTAAKPTTLVLASGVQRIRWVLTWGHTNSNFITAIAVSIDNTASGADYGAVVRTFNFSYAANELLSSTDCGSLALATLVWSFGRALQLRLEFDAHQAGTGASVHGLGGMSLQDATTVNIDGGTIDGVSIGIAAAATDSHLTRATLVKASYSPTLNAAVVLSMANDVSEITVNGTNSVTFSNVPASPRVCTHLLEVSNLNSVTGNLSSAVIGPGGGNPWGASGKPSKAGRCLVAMTTDDGGTSWFFSLVWSAV